MALTGPERETTVTISDEDRTARIWTARRKDITKLRRNTKAIEVASGHHEGTEWAQFEIPNDEWNPASGIKRKTKPMTPAQRQAAAERFANMRRARNASSD